MTKKPLRHPLCVALTPALALMLSCAPSWTMAAQPEAQNASVLPQIAPSSAADAASAAPRVHAGASDAAPQAAAKKRTKSKAQRSHDWQGLYVGTLPCASCPGYYTELELSHPQQYRLKESAEESGALTSWSSKGRFVWNKKRQSITVGKPADQRRFLLQDNAIEQLGQDGQRVSGATAPFYRLVKVDRFQDPLGQMLVVRESVEQNRGKGATVQFDGRENFAAPKAAGQRSLTARYTLHCSAKTYEMANIAYFDALNGQGKALEVPNASTQAKDGAPAQIKLGKHDARMRKVFARYCRK